jgi:cation:H+ antiporter
LFEEQYSFWGNVALLALSLVILAKASDYAINNAIRVSNLTGFGKTTIGSILVGFATSLPELFVVVFAASGQGNVGIAIGNILGSNIANVALIIGTCFLIFALKSQKPAQTYSELIKKKIGNLYFGLFIASLVPLALLYLCYASRYMGAILLAIFFLNMYQVSRERRFKDRLVTEAEKRRLPRYVAMTFIAALGVVAASYFLVNSATYVAATIGLPGEVIGATIIAFGTSAPELATSVSAVRKGHLNIALGNTIGSCFINITLILGAALIASPFNVNTTAFSEIAIFSLITNLFLWYFLSSGKLTWREGAVFLFIYSIFIATSFSV